MRERRFGGDDRGPSRLPGRSTKDHGGYSPRRRNMEGDFSPRRRSRGGDYSPRQRIGDRDYSSPRRMRDRDYLSARRIRNSPPIRVRERNLSPPRRYQGRDYSPQAVMGNRDRSPPVRTRNREISPPVRTRKREISPPARAQNWKQHSPCGRSRERCLSPPRGQLTDEQPRGEYFHELERSRRMGIDGSGDFGELQKAQPLGYVGGDRDYGPSQSLRIPDHDRGNASMFGEPSHRLHEMKVGLGIEDSAPVKYPWSHLLDEPRKFDRMKGSSDYGNRDRVSSERENHGRPYSGFVDGSISSEADRRRLYSSYESHLSEVGVRTRISGAGSSGCYSRYLDAGNLKDEEIHLQDGFHPHKTAGGPVSRDLYIEDSLKSMRYSELNSDYMIPSSQSNVLPVRQGVIKDDIASSYAKEVQISSHGSRLSSGKIIESIGLDGYNKNPGPISPMNPEKQASGFRNYSESYFARSEERRETYSYSDIQRGEVASPNNLSSEFYGKRVGSGEAHFRDVARTNVGLGKYDEYSHRETLMPDKQQGSPLSLRRQVMPDYFESRRALDQRKPDVDILDYGANHLLYENETHQGYESSHKRDLHGYRMDDDLLERSDGLYRELDPRLEKIEARPPERFISRDLPGPSNVSLRERRGPTSNDGAGIAFSSDVRSSHKIHSGGDADEMWTSRDTDSVVMSRKLNVPHSKYGKNGRTYKGTTTNNSTRNLSVSMSSRSSKFSKPGGRDIKKRLGPRYQNLDIEHSLGIKNKPSVQKRLGPRLANNHAPPPWVKKFNSHKFSRNLDAEDESVAEQGDDPNEGIITPEKTEPPENSKDFKQLVQNAFFRFVRHLNETPAKRRKYSASAGSLKCLVCGRQLQLLVPFLDLIGCLSLSLVFAHPVNFGGLAFLKPLAYCLWTRDSEEFVDPERLALHALTSPKTGLRSQHLGLHKALCALKGWKSADAPSNEWASEMLSNAETVALKEDLIIWPPVVIVHNSSIMNSNPDERMIVSVEELESKLRDMGFGEKAKVSRGKPANQSILTVKFSATLSGLREAERLSDIYAHRKHGKADFERISRGQSDGGTEELLTDKVGHILYGYLGIAEDLDKLDFEMKKRSSVRSKKQIKDIAVAP